MEAQCRGGRVLFFPRFLFRGRDPGVFFTEEGRVFPFASSKGCFVFLFLPSTKGSAHSCVPCGDPTFLCVPRREPGIFFPEEGREPIFQRDASKGFVFFSVSWKGPDLFLFYREWIFPNSKGGLSQSHGSFHIPRKNFGNRRDPTAWFQQISG